MSPDLKIVAETIAIQVIDDSMSFLVVSVPPFVLSLPIQSSVAIMLASIVSLSNAGWSHNPYSSIIRLLISASEITGNSF